MVSRTTQTAKRSSESLVRTSGNDIKLIDISWEPKRKFYLEAQKEYGKSPGAKKKLTKFNKFMKAEMARLKEEEPEMSHQERFKVATANWKNAPENPKREKDA
ncbi:hypothetical protein VNI00_002232 [Paramarasmius palmivorus]|uniref:YABBY protein C-terminal domain-containing protein n=1 Tax=Paramarasmius palmivorus TaxID=297713 RepID=A0AAW0E0R9_9AGAR